MTLKNFLKGYIDKNGLKHFLPDNNLENVEVEDFFKKFGKMDRDQLIRFMKDPKNAYEICKFGYRYRGNDNIYGHKKISYDIADQAY